MKNNLKQVGIGILLYAYAQDWEGYTTFRLSACHPGLSAAYRAFGDLRNYVTPATICCPTAKPFQYTTSRPDAFYGFRTAAAAIGVVSTNIFNGSSGTAKVDAIEQPASFWVISDSLTVPNGSWSGAMPGQTYYLSQRFNNSPGSATTASAGGTAHFRHGGNINLLFIDGHVESASKARFAEVTKVHCSAAENFWWVQDEKGNLEKLTW